MSVDEVRVFDASELAAAAPAAGETPVLDLAPSAPELPKDFPVNAVAQGDGSYLLTLEHPVKFRLRQADGKITEDVTRTVHLHRLKGKHQNEIRRAGPEDAEAQMLACSAQIDFGRAKMLADEMDAADLSSVRRVLSFFQTPGRVIGPRS